MQTVTEFMPMSDRYAFDFRLCPFSKGWAQLDTRQDASYYGNWINPLTRQICSFAEGDVTIITCDDDAEFIAQVTETFGWHKERGYEPAIDGMCSEPIVARFNELGLAHMLH
jgi:hypothetical protein